MAMQHVPQRGLDGCEDHRERAAAGEGLTYEVRACS